MCIRDRSYDELTEDVEYEKRADFVEKLFLRAKRPVRSLLDLACGTGTMTELFARRGYTVTGVDYSPEMLAQAQQKLATLDPPPLLLCQSMPQLKLLEKVDAAICCLDSINYLMRPRDVQRTFARLHDACLLYTSFRSSTRKTVSSASSRSTTPSTSWKRRRPRISKR